MVPETLAGVEIKYASVAHALENVIARGVLWQASERQFLLDVPNVARFLVESGKSVTIEKSSDLSDQEISSYFRMAPLAALLYQRGTCALHAAAVAKDDFAVLLAGDSGVGKSTLLVALLQRGWRLLSDDLSIVDISNKVAVISPTYPEIALWPESIEKLNLGFLENVSCDANRQWYYAQHKFENEPRELKAIIWLGITGKTGCSIEEITGGARFRSIGLFQYNSHIAEALLAPGAYMSIASIISGLVPLYRLNRPRGEWSVDSLADMVESSL